MLHVYLLVGELAGVNSVSEYLELCFLGFHVDDSEVTLNVCLGKQFSGGELFFRGVRCERHVNTETQTEVGHIFVLSVKNYVYSSSINPLLDDSLWLLLSKKSLS